MTNKIITLLFAMMLLPTCYLRAQTSPTTLTPDFEFYLYATDALGNKDSVLLGYSDDTTISLSDYGTDLRGLKFNDTLDLRVIDWGWQSSSISSSWKKGYEYWNCYTAPYQSSAIVLGFSCQFPPISFSWDMAAFQQDSCRFNSVITSNSDYLQHPHNNAGLHAILSNESNMILTLDTAAQAWYSYPNDIYPRDTMQSGAIDTVYSVHLSFSKDPITVSVRKTNQSNSIRIFPTLASDILYLDIQDLRGAVAVRIVDMLGQLVYQDFNSTTTLPIHTLPQGIYLVEVQTDTRIARQQIVKS